MAQVINTNVSSLFAGAALNKSASALQTAQQRLSSGLRINSVKDDATGLGIATTYDSTIRGTNVAIRSANDAVSIAQTLDGYAAQVIENLQRLREILIQTGDDATGAEAVALIAENARIADLAATAGTDLVGADIIVDGDGGVVAATSTDLSTVTGDTAADVLDDIDTIIGERENFGADIATYSSAVATMQAAVVNLSAAYSRIMDTDYAAETTNMTRNQILQQAGIAALAQSNQNPSMVLSLLR
jgi:flagellin